MPIPDLFQQIIRVKQAIARMTVQYQNKGKYLDLNGRECSDSSGIIDAMEELDKLEYCKQIQPYIA